MLYGIFVAVDFKDLPDDKDYSILFNALQLGLKCFELDNILSQLTHGDHDNESLQLNYIDR